MGRKNGCPKSPHRFNNPNSNLSIWAKDYQFLGRRISSGEYKVIMIQDCKNDSSKLGSFKGIYGAKRQTWIQKHLPSIIFTFVLLGFLFLLDSFMFSVFHPPIFHIPNKSEATEDSRIASNNEAKPPIQMYDRLLKLASSAIAEREFKQDETKFWKEQYPRSSSWKPCADKNSPKNIGKTKNSTGFIFVSANGGLNQQRVAVCNAVAVASLLNATLVIPRFLYSNVWTDPSQFGDIYQDEYFMNVLKDDVNIVKDLPPHLISLDFEAIGSLITDADIKKEATPDEYIEKILPLLLRNGVVHFLGYGNRLGFDPLPFELQKLRCKCNFHALKFVPKIQETGSLLIQRIRKYEIKKNMLKEQLVGNYMPNIPLKERNTENTPTKYLALHLRFEVDMVAYSLCEFGGGETERSELEAYRKLHFPLLIDRLKNSTYVSPEELRKFGKCPLTPEESALVLAGLGFKRNTYIYLAGSSIYGGGSRMKSLTTLYPNLITKEDLLRPNELAPFKNFSSQLAALDFIACATSDVFAITDSGSQLSSLVSGFRTYYGGGHAPTLKPVKRKLASILSRNESIEWNVFEEKVRKMIEDGQRVRIRGIGRSIYRHPRCPQCMCKSY